MPTSRTQAHTQMTAISYGLSMTSSIRLTFPSDYDGWEEGNGHHLIMLELRKTKNCGDQSAPLRSVRGIWVGKA
ncbi:hypothetical protein PILCRDRAFT_819913 [Piloderma croceum F 1598]|uniref:Uncharacterized protein n=1 Tax=Piloderma croceum (strain F 1598) TaxID=765440 RepID=A0A0C3FY36_PILCF|nr:hypothetical protein PILCRDRAFT_819913 [Piloderma croceum F 1598]